MMDAAAYDHEVEALELIETHISWVVLAGEYAYKIKKPVDFGFLDFSSLDKREHCCREELRLNRRLASDIYLDVVAIAECDGRLHIDGEGKVIEYAVKMRRFPQQAQLDRVLQQDAQNLEHIEATAELIADFHLSLPPLEGEFGLPTVVSAPVEENFMQIRQALDADSFDYDVDDIQRWAEAEGLRIEPLLRQRKSDGFIRECHGDLHLANLVCIEGRVMAFDCIEFSEALRCIDVISEIAFLVMDLESRGWSTMAYAFINSYLERTGDYAGMALLPYYCCYRAMVRAKVEALRLSQAGMSSADTDEHLRSFHAYLDLARSYTRRSKVAILLMYGVSASGKSGLSAQLMRSLPALRLRSDVERKRLFSHTAAVDAALPLADDCYSEDASRRVYAHLLELSSNVLSAGYNVIVDATFLQRQQRDIFKRRAQELAASFVIVETRADREVLRQRILDRRGDASDADLSVLEAQLDAGPCLTEDEMAEVFSVDTGVNNDIEVLVDRIKDRVI